MNHLPDPIAFNAALQPAVADHMIYLVFENSKTGPVLCEREVSDLDRKTTIEDIASGQFEDFRQVLECNPVEGTCRDVTEDMTAEVCSIWADSGDPLSYWQRDFAETFLGIPNAYAFRLEDA